MPPRFPTFTFLNGRIGEIRPLIYRELGGLIFAPFLNRGCGGHFLLDYVVDSCPGDTVSLGDLSQTLAELPITDDGLAIQIERLAADVATFEPGAPHAGADPLDDQIPL